jgi:hypothetical protein
MLGSHRHHVGYILPWLLLELTQRKALTEPNIVASTPNDAAWAGHIFLPVQSVIEPLGESGSLSSTKAIITLSLRRTPCNSAVRYPSMLKETAG